MPHFVAAADRMKSILQAEATAEAAGDPSTPAQTPVSMAYDKTVTDALDYYGQAVAAGMAKIDAPDPLSIASASTPRTQPPKLSVTPADIADEKNHQSLVGSLFHSGSAAWDLRQKVSDDVAAFDVYGSSQIKSYSVGQSGGTFITWDPFIIWISIWPLMVVSVIILAVVAGIGEAFLQRKMRSLWSALFVYALPTSLLMSIAVFVAYFVYAHADDPEYWACRVQACRTAISIQRDRIFWLEIALIEVAAIAMIALLYVIRNRLVPGFLIYSPARRRMRAEAAAAATRRRDRGPLLARIEERFPPRKLFFVSDKLRSILNMGTNQRNPAIFEDYDDWWVNMLERYPEPPRNMAESKEREQAFWTRYADNYTTKSTDGQPSLKPQQYIMDDFRTWEKWIFRDYYAATGTINKTIIEEISRLTFEENEALEYSKFYTDKNSTSTNPHRMKARDKFEQASKATRQFLDDTMPAHYDKWGKWFFFHVEEAFNRRHQTETNYGPQTPTTPTEHPAHDDLAYKPNT